MLTMSMLWCDAVAACQIKCMQSWVSFDLPVHLSLDTQEVSAPQTADSPHPLWAQARCLWAPWQLEAPVPEVGQMHSSDSALQDKIHSRGQDGV